ncbi:MAG: alpha/beta hydrolase [Pseudolysinimonas sp.]
MLLVTAVLTSSVALGSVSEAFVLHEISHFDSAIVGAESTVTESTVTESTVAETTVGRAIGDVDPTGPSGLGNLLGVVTTTTNSLSSLASSAVAPVTTALASVAPVNAVLAPVTSVVASTVDTVSSTVDTVSSTVNTVTAPLGVSVSAPTLTSVLSVPDAPPVPFIGPVSDPNELVQGTRFLQQLTLQHRGTMASYLKAHAAVVAQLIASPPAATQVTNWWGLLDLATRNELRAASPVLVGNLDGIPYQIRDLANRALLKDTMSQLRSTIAGESGRTVVENAKVQLKMLQSISDALGSPTSASPHRSLLTLDVNGQGKAAIVLGDLRTATYVSYLVPGMFFTIENQMGDWVNAAGNLYDEELSWLTLLDPDAANKSVATVAWIGYHTPNLTNVGGIQNADEGRDSLASAIEGLQAVRKGNEPYTTIIAHSYGSTAALMALTEYDFSVDALAMVGSPGSAAKSVADLHVRPGHVWVGEAAWDPIPNSSYFGSDPGSKGYGAKSMGVGGGLDSLTHHLLQASTGHNEYFSAGTESMRNFALIAINKGEYVTPAAGQ